MTYEIGIEGHEYTGKTSVTKVLAEKYDYTTYSQPGPLRDFLKNNLLNQPEPNLQMIALAFALDRWYSQTVTFKDETCVIYDRTIFSSFALNAKTEKDPFQEALYGNRSEAFVAAINSYVKAPDLVFWLRIGDQELKKRIEACSDGRSDTFDKQVWYGKERYEEVMPKMCKEFRNTKFIEIFCDNKTPEEIADEIHLKILEVCGCGCIMNDNETVWQTFRQRITRAFGKWGRG